jgi:asparagine synthase (glutamine-hydrolysing)
MCGISGLLYDENTEEHKKMLLDFFSSSRNICHRGPDRSTYTHLLKPHNTIINFERLSINDLSTNGDQPFIFSDNKRSIYVTCNGEIYNNKELEEKYNLTPQSNSDCEVILLLYQKLVTANSMSDDITIETICHKLSNELNGEFAFSILDIDLGSGDYNFILVNDKFGMRPLFVGKTVDRFYYASELQGLPLNEERTLDVKRFPPRNYGVIQKKNNVFSPEMSFHEYYSFPLFNEIKQNNEYDVDIINKLLTESVNERMCSDRPLGFLLSGGLDSSLTAALGAKYLKHFGKTARTFSIGLENGTDQKYAEMAANHIGSIHTHVIVTKDDFLATLPKVIKIIGSYDVTTIRASCGQYMISEYIAKNTDIKVLLIGDGADELLGGYKYEQFAPSDEEFHNDCIRLLNEIHCFDGLRADRCISHFGIEARFPFLNTKFVEYMLTNGKVSDRRPQFNNLEKSIVRLAFKNDNLLPDEVLFRVKEAFSDGVSSKEKSWYEMIQDDIVTKISDFELIEYQLFGNNISSTYTEKFDDFEKAYWRRIKQIEEIYWKSSFNSDENYLLRNYKKCATNNFVKSLGNDDQDCNINIEIDQKFKKEYNECCALNILHIPPTSKEALYFRRLFENSFTMNNSVSKTIPHLWLPKFCGDVTEPSARILPQKK